MSIMINGFTITSLEKIHGYDRVNKTCAFLLDELRSATISATEDTTDITGKGDRVLKQIKKNKGVTVSGESALISGGLLAAQTGSEQETGTVTVRMTEIVTVENTTSITTSEKAKGAVGHEILDLCIVTDNGGLGKKYEQKDEVSAGAFTYNPSTKTLTLPTDSTNIKVGTKIAIFYDFDTEGSSVKDMSDVFGKTLYLVIDALATDVCDNEYKCQFVIPRAQFSGEFEIEMGGDQTIQNFEATTLVDTCAGTTSGELFEFIVYQ